MFPNVECAVKSVWIEECGFKELSIGDSFSNCEILTITGRNSSDCNMLLCLHFYNDCRFVLFVYLIVMV